jgi:hypothetical protein
MAIAASTIGIRLHHHSFDYGCLAFFAGLVLITPKT